MRVGLGLGIAVAALALTGCTIGEPERLEPVAHTSTAAPTTSTPTHRPPKASVANGETKVEPLGPITVEAQAGLAEITMTNDAGKEVEAELNADKTKWETSEPLGYGRTYTIEAKDEDGQSLRTSFTTVTPTSTASAYMGPLDGSTVGVAQAVTIRFDQPIKDTKAVEDAIEVETSNDTEGGFFWIDPYELRWRPKEYWEPGTEVTVHADLYGKNLGGGVYGAGDTETSFSIGELTETVVDNNLKLLRVYRNHELVREFPISLGRDGQFDTPNGIYVVGDAHKALTMDSRTYGLGLEKGGYVTDVDYATQLSYSGIYVHSAPWAAGALGSYNQSHGCINASYENAKWFQEYVRRGDPVEVRGTAGATLTPYDGLGYWNLDWEQRSGGSLDPLYP